MFFWKMATVDATKMQQLTTQLQQLKTSLEVVCQEKAKLEAAIENQATPSSTLDLLQDKMKRIQDENDRLQQEVDRERSQRSKLVVKNEEGIKALLARSTCL